MKTIGERGATFQIERIKVSRRMCVAYLVDLYCFYKGLWSQSVEFWISKGNQKEYIFLIWDIIDHGNKMVLVVLTREKKATSNFSTGEKCDNFYGKGERIMLKF